jgi:hypothetical protein
MLPNFRLCDCCKNQIPPGMNFFLPVATVEVETEEEVCNAPQHFDPSEGKLLPTVLKGTKHVDQGQHWELCNKCAIELIRQIVKLESNHGFNQVLINKMGSISMGLY